jgi:hypothetical protein
MLSGTEEEAKKCVAGITDKKLKRLVKEKPEEICKTEGHCHPGQFEKTQKESASKIGIAKNETSPMPPIPEIHLKEAKNSNSGNSTTENEGGRAVY